MIRRLNPDGCQKRVHGVRDIFGSQCQNKPTVTRNGERYCKIHDPEYIGQKDILRREKWAKEDTENLKRRALQNARNKATEGLTLRELELVTPDLIRKAIDKLAKCNKEGRR